MITIITAQKRNFEQVFHLVKKFICIVCCTQQKAKTISQKYQTDIITGNVEHCTDILPPFPFCPQLLVQLVAVFQEVILPLL